MVRRGGVNYADASRLGLCLAMSTFAAISAMAISKSVREGDRGSASSWRSVYVASILLAALCFERLL